MNFYLFSFSLQKNSVGYSLIQSPLTSACLQLMQRMPMTSILILNELCLHAELLNRLMQFCGPSDLDLRCMTMLTESPSVRLWPFAWVIEMTHEPSLKSGELWDISLHSDFTFILNLISSRIFLSGVGHYPEDRLYRPAVVYTCPLATFSSVEFGVDV